MSSVFLQSVSLSFLKKNEVVILPEVTMTRYRLVILGIILLIGFASAAQPPVTDWKTRCETLPAGTNGLCELLSRVLALENAVNQMLWQISQINTWRTNFYQSEFLELEQDVVSIRGDLDTIVSVNPGQCPVDHYVTGIDPDGDIICSPVCPVNRQYCPGYGCTELLSDPLNCGACGVHCYDLYCLGGVCITGSCQDGIQNGPESDVDCGGLEFCPRCEDGKMCTGDWDCQSGYCGAGGVCLPLP